MAGTFLEAGGDLEGKSAGEPSNVMSCEKRKQVQAFKKEVHGLRVVRKNVPGEGTFGQNFS